VEKTVPQSKPSFSPYRKWRIGFHVCLASLIVLSVVVMVNYLSRDYFARFYLSERTKIRLQPRTLKLLESLTNEVKVTLYYDKKDRLYSTVAELLNHYATANPKISVQTVDYQRDPAGAQKVKAHYGLAATTDKNLVIFDCNGRVKSVEGKALGQYTLEPMPDQSGTRRKLEAFLGERVFTSVLLWVTSPKPLKAFFLQGHGEHVVDSPGDNGYMRFAAVLRQNSAEVAPLSLLGTNSVPAECNLLVIAGATAPLLTNELEKIEKYLNEGGRLLVLFNTRALDKETGLEKILASWGVNVSGVIVRDPKASSTGSDVVLSAFSKHPMVNPILGSGLYLEQPRPVGVLKSRTQAADAPRVEAIAFSGENAFMEGDPKQTPHRFPLMVAVEKGAIKGVSTERGTTRMLVAGDSIFLDNNHLDLLANREFATSAADWLLDRTQLLGSLSESKIAEYRFVMTSTQFQKAEWILLAGMPGGTLLLGGLVWLRRRR
jgi:hypothetical protein